MDSSARQLEALIDLERRHEDLLERLDDLNRRVESVLAECSPARIQALVAPEQVA
jgi:tetrahydromethanopterin S-methyltransferase subunit G